MPNQNKSSSQTNQYDKIFRENMEVFLPGMIKHLLKLSLTITEEIPDDIQHTKERKPDLLKRVTDKNNQTYVLHIEYQVHNDKNMIYRMAEYSIMLQRKYKLFIKQYVIFIGNGKPNMILNLKTENFQFRYNMLTLSAIHYKTFLKSDNPEEKILAILANFEKEDPASVIKNILQEVKSSSGSDLAENRYFNQLRILVQLRNLETQFKEAMDSITTFFKEERDILFCRGEIKGIEKGIEKGRHQEALQIARNLKKEGLKTDFIARTTQLSINEIEQL